MWSQVADFLQEPLLILDDEDRIRFANTAARSLMGGYSVVGEHISSFQRTPELLETLSTVRAQSQSRTVRYRLLTPITRHFKTRICPLRRGQLLLLVRETTLALQAQKTRTEFAAQASHALKTPLTVLLGAIETLERDPPKTPKTLFSIIEAQGRRMQKIVEGLLSLGRIEAQEHIPPSEPLDLVALVRGVCADMHVAAQAAGVTLNVTAPGVLAPVLGHPEALVQVFENLLSNALIHAAEGKKVDVLLEQASSSPAIPHGVQVVVRDYGQGIDPEHLPRLTERFYRIEKAIKGRLPGAGLGLAIVKHIVNSHRGLLHITSAPGEGSRFVVILPTILSSQARPGPE